MKDKDWKPSENCSGKFGKRKEQTLTKANGRGKRKLCDLERTLELGSQ